MIYQYLKKIYLEIQSTHVIKGGLHYSGWEERIRKQIDQDIIYGRCLFFFDEALLRAMKNAGRGISINMDWFRKYMKEGKLEVFTVTYDGIVEPKEYKDFNFLAKISQTCSVAAQNDDMIINKNKMKIYIRVIKGYGFTQEEIDKFESDFEKYREISKISGKDNYDRIKLFLKRQTDERAKLYGTILQAMGGLSKINQILCINIYKDISTYVGSKYLAKILGILDIRGYTNSSTTKFIDRFDICKYFPGYLRNKEIWDKLRGRNLNGRQFDNVITGRTDVIKGIDYYFSENSNTNSNKEENIIKEIDQNQTCDDKEVNIKIGNKDQIINISIKTKQKSIEDAWT